MEIRGERRCKECDTRWSYYDTGSVACPACGSLVSVGVDDRTTHTATPVGLDLTDHRDAVERADLAEVTDDLKSDLRAYVRRRGFVDAGALLDLDDAYLAAGELLQAADVYDRLRSPAEDERLYALSLLAGADAGERPAPDRVPESMREARGLAYADAILAYRGEVVDWADGQGVDAPAARRTLGRVVERAKRARALEGDVPPAEMETLVSATREAVSALRDGEESALATARSRLDRLD